MPSRSCRLYPVAEECEVLHVDEKELWVICFYDVRFHRNISPSFNNIRDNAILMLSYSVSSSYFRRCLTASPAPALLLLPLSSFSLSPPPRHPPPRSPSTLDMCDEAHVNVIAKQLKVMVKSLDDRFSEMVGQGTACLKIMHAAEENSKKAYSRWVWRVAGSTQFMDERRGGLMDIETNQVITWWINPSINSSTNHLTNHSIYRFIN